MDRPFGYIIFRLDVKSRKTKVFFNHEAKSILFPPSSEGRSSPPEISALCSKWKEIFDQRQDELRGSGNKDIQSQVYIDFLQSWRRKYTVRGTKLSEKTPITKENEESYLFILERYKPENLNLAEVLRDWNLNHREQEIVRLIFADCGNKEIANHLGISINTVKAYLKLLMRKLGVHTRAGILSTILTGKPKSPTRLLNIGFLISLTYQIEFSI